MSDVVSVVEAAYRADLSEVEWLRSVVEASHPLLERGHGLMAFGFDASSGDGLRVGEAAGRGIMMPGWKQLIRRYGPKMGRGVLSKTLGGPRCAALSETAGAEFLDTNGLARKVRLFGIRDLLCVNARDLDGRGCVIAAPLPQRTATSEEDRELWSRVAAHLVAGLRLRARLARSTAATDPLEHAEAVMSPDGHVEHAQGEAVSKDARAALRGAAIAIDRARGALRRREPSEAVDLWRGLVDGRWTIVDHFDRSGRRYVVAQRNEPTPRAGTVLTHRERQVLGYAALGHTNKLIAYELGLSTSTVATHLSQAARKLGVTSRAALLLLFQRGQL